MQLYPLLALSTVPTQDGPAHLAGAWVLLHSGDDDAVGALLREQYRLDLTPVPNMLTTLALAGLLTLVGPDTAERLLVAAVVVGLVAALAYAARGVSRRAWWLGAAALPFAGSHLLSYGFYNFALGVVGALLLLGVALRRRAGWSPAAVAVLAVLAVLTWTAHLLPWVVGVGGVLLLAVARAAAGVRGGQDARSALARDVVPVVVAVLPSGVLTVVYLVGGDGPPATPEGGPSAERLLDLLRGAQPFVTEWGSAGAPAAVGAAAAVATAVLLVLGVLALRRGPGSGPERAALGLLLAGAVLAAWLTPQRLGADFGFLAERVAWFPPLLLALWVATRPPGRRGTAVAVVVLVTAASVGALARFPAQRAAVAEAEELLSVAAAIPPAATLVVLRYSRSAVAAVPRAPDPMRHESSRLAVQAGGADVGLYEAAYPYFQVSFEEPALWRRMTADLGGLERVPPAVRLETVRGDLDVVVVVGLDRATEQVRDSPHTRAVRTELSAHYTRVATSAPTGLVQVWRADPAPAAVSAGDGPG
ncbi:hypothetical protein [Geodermatophilus sp. SYSU D00079]